MKNFRILMMSLLLVCVFTVPALGAVQGPVSQPAAINGLTADQWMAQSSANMQKANSYQGNIDMSMAMIMNGIPDQPDPMSMDCHAIESLFVQMNPMVMYARQTIDMSGIPGIPPGMSQMVNESLIKDNSLYSNVMATGWKTMPLGSVDFQDILNTYNTQDPVKMLDQMRQYGIQCAFAQPVTISGKEYVVIDVTADPNQLLQQVKVLLDQMTIPLQGQGAQDLGKLLDTMTLDLSYRMYIDKQSVLPDKADMNIQFGMSIPNPENAAQVATLNMTMQGTVTYFGYGQSYVLPDVSQSVPINNPTTQISI